MAAPNKSILQRVEEIEIQLQTTRGFQAALQNLQQATRQTLGIVGAFIQEMGGDELDKRIAQRMADQQEAFEKARLDEQRKMLEDLVKTGQLGVAESVSKDAVVTFKQFQIETVKGVAGEDGVVAPDTTKETLTDEYTQLHFSQIPAEVSAKLVGLKAGESFTDAVNGYRVEIINSYTPQPAKPVTTTDVPPAEAPAATEPAPEASTTTEPAAAVEVPTATEPQAQ